MAETATPQATESAVPDTAAAPREDVERAALLAELDGEFGGSAEHEDVPQRKGRQPREREATVAEVDGGEGEGAAEEAEEAAEDGVRASEEVLEHAKALAAAGDIRKLEEFLGLEKGALKVDGSKFRYLRQRQEKADRAVADATRQRDEATSLVTQAQEQYGPMVRAKQLFASGTPQGVQQAARFVERHFGTTLAQFVDTVVKAGRGEPGQPRAPQTDAALEELRAEVQRLKQEREAGKREETERAASERHVGIIKSKLAGTALAPLSDAAHLVYAKLKSSYDPAIDGYKLSLRDAIQAVADDPATKWRLHERAQKSQKTRSDDPVERGKPPAYRRAAGARGQQRRPMSEAEERQALIAELEADARKEERASRYGKR